ncbi:hypothetical protein NECAME_15382 [Necator americanus]|uniref:BED-type domain-containing protein n=1 Tax=Necator americanus TaxID=51031 RepID=W2SKT6_NECAM|nr:hypothetical protein NECAME_15382 [Necator americanus]ETN69337.1 hypothetical protein NECAME_15382 [Necator americanus]
MDTTYLATSYSYEEKDYFEPSVAVLPTPCSFQQPQHGHLYPIVSQPIPIQGGTQLAVENFDTPRNTDNTKTLEHFTVFRPFQNKEKIYRNDPQPIQELSKGNDQYEQPLSLQPSMFYYAAAAAAGPSLISQQDSAHSTLNTKTTVDDNGGCSNGVRKRSTKRGRPTKNPVWTFFRRVDDKSVQCNMCARLVKSACATNMSKHLERHHQNTAMTTANTIDRVDFGVQKYDQQLVGNYSTHQQSSWNPYAHHMQPLKHVK